MEAPVLIPTWIGLFLLAFFLVGTLVAVGVLVAVLASRSRSRSRSRPVVARPIAAPPTRRRSLLPEGLGLGGLALVVLALAWMKLRHGEWLSSGEIGILGLLALMYLMGFVWILRVIRGRRPNTVRAMPAPSSPRPPAGPGYLLLAAGWSLGGLLVAFCLVGLLIANLSWKNSRTQINSWEESLIATVVFVFIPLAVLTAARFTWINRKRLVDSVLYAHEAPPRNLPVAALIPTPAAPAPAAPAPPRTCPKCGRTIAAGAPEGLCPRCLIGNLLPEEPRHSPTTAYGPFVPPEVEEVAPFFPQLEIIKLIGQGGMGAVYLARQKQLDRLVALKLINVREDDPTFAERFNREAKAMGKLSHPNIVAIHDHGTADGLPYLIMEYVDGVTLRDAIRAKTLSPAEALKIIPQVCDALEYAHSQGVVHRDVKPENILLDQSGKVKIADFGLAKLVDPDGLSLTHTRQAMGTPHYMAPEQWERPTEVDHRADIYALGVLLYELLTGELPLGRFDPPSVKARVDARIDELVLRALSKEPDRRYQHASDMKLALQGIERSPRAARCASGFYEYKSKTTLLGWPLVHVVRGIDPAFGQHRTAKGWIAIGDGTAVGGLAIAGGWAVGGLAIAGGGAVGVLALAGGGALGIISLAGGWAAGVGVAAAGGGSAAPGLAAAGGVAAGKFAIAGGAAWGEHVISSQSQDPAFGEQLLTTLQQLWEGVLSLVRRV